MMKSIKPILASNSLRGATGILAITMALSNILGLLRNTILAKNISFDALDTYYAAFRIPDLLFNVLIFGALSTAFIPVFTGLAKDDKQRWQLVNSIINLILISLLAANVILLAIMPLAIKFIAPGFSALRLEHTTSFARILLLSPLFFGISYVFAGVLQSYKKFWAYSIAPIIYNLSIIVGAIMAPRYGVTGVIWSTVIGAFLHMLIQAIASRSLGFKYQFFLNIKNESIKKIGKLMIPRSISLALAQINIIAFTALGSHFKNGAIAIYSLTNDFQTAPTVILTTSIATAIFPNLSEYHNQKQKTEFNSLLAKAIRLTIFLLLPTATIIYLLRAQIMRLYIALGSQVSWEDTIRAIDTLGLFTISLVFQGLVIILSRAHYAKHDTRIPMYFNAAGTGISVAIAWMLAKYTGLDVAGLALAFSIGSFANALLLAIPLLAGKEHAYSWQNLGKIIVATLIMGFFAWITLQIIGDGMVIDGMAIAGLGTDTVFGLLIQLVGALSVGTIAYYIFTRAFRCQELEWLSKK